MITNVGHNKLCHSYYIYAKISKKKKETRRESFEKWYPWNKYRDRHIAVYITEAFDFGIYCFSIKI